MAQALRTANGWNMQSHHVKQLLGIKGKLPVDASGYGPWNIQGWQVYILGLAEARKAGLFHRVRAICPDCGADISAGRTHQHKCTFEGLQAMDEQRYINTHEQHC